MLHVLVGLTALAECANEHQGCYPQYCGHMPSSVFWRTAENINSNQDSEQKRITPKHGLLHFHYWLKYGKVLTIKREGSTQINLTLTHQTGGLVMRVSLRYVRAVRIGC